MVAAMPLAGCGGDAVQVGIDGPTALSSIVLEAPAVTPLRASKGGRYELAARGELALSDAERRGRELYFSERTRCSSCHGTTIAAESAQANGTPIDLRFHDIGLHEVGLNDSGPQAAGDGRDTRYKSPMVTPVDLTRAEQADLLGFLLALADPAPSNPIAPR